MRYRLYTYDLWGNARDGYDVNDVYRTGVVIELPDDASDYLINRRLGERGITWDGEPGYVLYGNSSRDPSKPVAELRAITD